MAVPAPWCFTTPAAMQPQPLPPEAARVLAEAAQAAEQLNQLSTQLQLLAMALDELTTVTDPVVQAQLAATADAVIARAKRVG